MREILRKWWDGTYVPAPKTDLISSAFVVSFGTYRRSLSSMVAHTTKNFWIKHWQWTVSITLTIFFGFWKR